jgi:hypothetical protein
MITDRDLLAYNRRGLIPGPEEEEGAFLERVARLEFLERGRRENRVSQEEWREAHLITEPLFDISPDWVSAFYSDEKLSPWQGAMTWVEEGLPFFQLRRGFKKGRYLGIYERKEILAHEAVHVSRALFNEPKFEEVLAYRVSRYRWRQWVGPLFRSPWESTLAICLMALFPCVQWLRLFFGDHLLFVLPIGLSGSLFVLASLRLGWTHYRFRKCVKKIEGLLKGKGTVLAFVCRLTDREILLFSKSSEEEIRGYIRQESSLRWRLLSLCYL